MYKGTEIINYMEEHLGDRGAEARAYCHLGAGEPWCNAEVTLAFHEIGESKLFCNGRKETYCPHSIQWCYKNLASLPIYLALEGDVVYFDWERNGVPNHIGFARHRISDLQLATVEGNTSGGKIDNKVREVAYIQAVFRPLYPVDKKDFDASKELEIDGCFGFNSVAVMQRFLMIEIDGSLGLNTVKAWQRFLGVTADGDWGVKTTKATQKLVGVKVDGYCGKKTVIGLQKWLNKQVFSGGQPITKPSTTTTSSKLDKILDACKAQAQWMKNYTYKWEAHPTVPKSKKYGTCVTYVACVLQRLNYLKSGECIWHDTDGKVYGANSKMSVSYPKGTLKSLKDKLKGGDVVMAGNPSVVKAGASNGSHIFILTGKWDGNDPIIWDNHSCTRVKQGKGGAHSYSGSKQVIAVVRLK